ncbi:porin family protein [Lacinutrix sp. 5H-3-7-4]|uniref:type IX secretion/gliding motility protein PorT/SprT n=1 Tax=Lacinutrix sp. (strain 5H-3-7-4) TaxID=983544 RepID=UPI00020A37CB|nr:porin family protein [Lacinutrix sp. 5H-3-7-4]AEH00375.1 PorT protein [Lacinutrix sp. 5H-3-7-4]
MKKVFALLTFLIVVQTGYAQLFTKEKVKNNENLDKQTLSWGYYFGTNNLDYKFDYNDNLGDIHTQKTYGFNVGLVGDIRANDYINFRLEPGLVIASRNITYPENFFANYEEEINASDLLREVKSTYIYVPLIMRLSTQRFNNFKPFVTLGIATSINLSSNENNPEDNSNGEFRTTKNTFFYDIGFGIDFYLYWFKFTPSIRGVFAINDELIRDNDPNSPWTGNINSMKTRGVFINFTFR